MGDDYSYTNVHVEVDTDELHALSVKLGGIRDLLKRYDAGIDPFALGHPDLVNLFVGGVGTNDFYQHWGDRRQQICDAIDKLTQALDLSAKGYDDTDDAIKKAMPQVAPPASPPSPAAPPDQPSRGHV